MNICIVGNSHVAAIRRAVRAGFAVPDGGTILVAGATSPCWQNGGVFRLDGTCLVPKDDSLGEKISADFADGDIRIDLKRIDCFVIHGLVPNFFSFNSSLAKYETSAHAPRRLFGGRRKALRHISKSCLEQCAVDYFTKSRILTDTVLPLVRMVRAVSDMPVFLSPNPNPVPSIQTSSTHSKRKKERLRPDIVATHLDVAARATKTAFSGERHPPFWLDQPAETIVDGIYTKEEFGVVRDDDYGHMGAEYGTVFLRQLVARLQAATRTS